MFRTTINIVNSWICKYANPDDDKTIFKVVEKEKIHIKTNQKAFPNFDGIKLYF